MTYTSVFGGTTIYPSDVSYLALSLTADVALEWPLESSSTLTPAARIIDVVANGAHTVSLPDATQTGAGQVILFNNVTASASTFYVKDFVGNAVATVTVGTQWEVYLTDTSTSGGQWEVLQMGASTATVQPSALAGYGITTTSNTLSQSLPVTTFTATPRTVLDTDRASALVWTGAGLGTLDLLSAATAGNNFFIAVRNSGGGDLTIDPAGGDLIDGAATLTLRPGDSASLLTNGLQWFSLGLGQEAVFAFDFTTIDLTGLTGTYTLAGSELNRVAYSFVGAPAGNIQVVVPSTVQQYWVHNGTSGPYTLSLRTASSSPVSVNQGSRGIYYCTGTAVVNASTAGISVPISATDGGTGQTSYTTGDLLYADTTTSLARLADAAIGNALLSGGVGVAPAWGKVDMAATVSGLLPVANGGTGASDAATARTNLGLGTIATQAASNVAITGGSITGITDLAVADGGTGASDAATARTNLGATTVGANVFTLANPSAVTFLQVNADNTVSALGAAAFRTATGATTVGANVFTLTNPSAVTFLQVNADNTVSALDAASFRTAIGAGSGGGTVTSVAADGGTTGLTFTGSPITTSGTLTLGGTLAVANGGTGAATLTGVVIGNGTSAFTTVTAPSGAIVGTTDTQTLTNKTLSTGNSINAGTSVSDTGTIAAASVGFRGLPQLTKSASYTLGLTDAGKHISTTTGGIVIPANSSVAFPIGTTIVVFNNSGTAQNISITTDTLRLAGTATTGTRSLAQYGLATLVKVANTTWVASGNVT